MKYLIFLLCLLSFFPVSSQSIGQEDESRLYAETKQVNQFFRRFNGEEDQKGNRYYSKDKEYRSPNLRKNYLKMLFDASNTGIPNDRKAEFAEDVIADNSPVFLNFHGGDWFAEVNTTFRLNGKDQTFILYMSLEKDGLGTKWVINKVYSDAFANYMNIDTTRLRKFIHPMSHELDFMNLRKAMNNKDSVAQFAFRDFKPDQLTLFLYEIEKGNLEFKTVHRVNFHFFQVKDWYFELSEFNRPGYNKGWLISDLVKVQDRDKDILRKFIYNEK
jgi:hypothetical protein